MKKRFSAIISLLLTLVMVVGLFVIPTPVEAAATPADIQDGVTLHCWNWSFKNIEDKMEIIAGLGYTAIQTSPIQLAKQPTKEFPTNDWWVFYQPADFVIDNSGNSALGTKAEFESMCAAAHKHGIKVIVDVVANHMGNNTTGTNGLSDSINPDLKNDADCWHDIKKNTNNYNNRQEVTQYCMAGLPDLNTANPKVQNYVLNFLKECIDAGADGFRFDAAKHIETPDDAALASNFWPTVIDGATTYAKSSRNIDLYCYGEILDAPGGGLSVKSYLKYMRVTDNGWSGSLLSGVSSGTINAAYQKGNADDVVIWPESHDTYADGTTQKVSEEKINKAWAIIAAREGAMGLYLARPANMSQWLGAASNTGWAFPEVAAVNHFRNAFLGQSEYVASENGIAYVERGNSGVVLVNTKGTTASVNVTAHTMADGTYTDQISGGTFTVAGGKISGDIGESGIAVVYNAEPCKHASHDAEGFCTECLANVGHEYDADGKCACGDVKVSNRIIYITNSKGWSKVNFYAWYNEIVIISNAWPGNPMTKVEGNIYSCEVPADTPNIIFNDGSAQTDDLTVPKDKNMFDIATGKWSVYGETEEPEQKPDTDATTPTETTAPTTPDVTDTPDDDNSNLPTVLIVAIIAVIILVCVALVVFFKKKNQ